MLHFMVKMEEKKTKHNEIIFQTDVLKSNFDENRIKLCSLEPFSVVDVLLLRTEINETSIFVVSSKLFFMISV